MGRKTDGQPPRQPQTTPHGGPMTRSGLRRRPGSRRYSLGMMLAGWLAVGLAVILVSGTLYGYAKFRSVWDGITKVAIHDPNAPPKLNNALNILVIGSDNRS